MVNFTINLYHDGCFVTNPLHYLEGDHRVVEDIDFEGVIYSEFCYIIRKLVIIAPVSYFYVKIGVQLNIGLKQLKTDEDLKEFVKSVDDPPFSDTESQDSLGDVKEGKFIGHMDDPIPNLNGRFMIEIDDLKQEVIDSIRFDTPTQLKQCLANYGVVHGYQLWYMQNDIHKLQVLCGRNVSEGRCAGKRGKKDCDSTEGQSSKVKNKKNMSTGEPSQISKAIKERWAKKKEEEKKNRNEYKEIMPTKVELTLEQSQQGVSDDVLVSIEGVEE
ncbi:hypothetical protein Tco_0508216 [Tanacetum coccineum]